MKHIPEQKFSLIELLVTIATIAILTSLLLPALNSARSKARAMTCLASQRSIGQYFAMYTLGYDDFWPASMDPGGRAWISQLINGGIIKRSSDAGAYAYNSGGKWVRYPGNANVCPELGIAAEQRVRCYAYPVSNNEKYPGVGGIVSDDYTSINKPMKGGRIKSPASVVALFENRLDKTSGQQVMNAWHGLTWFNFMNHSGRANFLFADGHAASQIPAFMGAPQGAVPYWSFFYRRISAIGF